LVFSAAFTQTLSPERWNELKRRFFRLHFQYLCAFDRPKDYDYFQITAGLMTLSQRYKGRPASKSRIEKAVNRYTSVAVSQGYSLGPASASVSRVDGGVSHAVF